MATEETSGVREAVPQVPCYLGGTCLATWVVSGLVIVEDDSPNQAITQCWEVEPRDS